MKKLTSSLCVTLSSLTLAAFAASATGCGGDIGDLESTEQAANALYGEGSSVLTVIKQNINFNGSTSPKFGTLGLTAYTTAPQWYTVTLAPNGPYQTACPPFSGGDTPQNYAVYLPTTGTTVTFPAPLLNAPASRGTCTMKTSIVFQGNPPNFFGQPQIAVNYLPR